MPRPQYRLRSLFILTAIVAVGCWVGPRAIAWHRQRRIEQAHAELDRLRDGLQLTIEIGCGSAIAGEEYEIERLENELGDLERR